jgi:hypothetical protein
MSKIYACEMLISLHWILGVSKKKSLEVQQLALQHIYKEIKAMLWRKKKIINQLNKCQSICVIFCSFLKKVLKQQYTKETQSLFDFKCR